MYAQKYVISIHKLRMTTPQAMYLMQTVTQHHALFEIYYGTHVAQ